MRLTFLRAARECGADEHSVVRSAKRGQVSDEPQPGQHLGEAEAQLTAGKSSVAQGTHAGAAEAEDVASSAATRARDGACDDTHWLVAALHSAQEQAKAAEDEAGALRIAHQRDEAASRDTIHKLQAEIKSERDRTAKVDALLQARRSCAALTYIFTHLTYHPPGERSIRGRDGFLAGYAAQLVH